MAFAEASAKGEDANVVTAMTYNADGNLQTLTAKNRAAGDQTTIYAYGTTLQDSALASNDLLRAEIYPDTADGADQVTFAYNRQGQTAKKTDQNGSVHEYEYDLLGRQAADAVTTLGAGVDGAVRRIEQSYEVRGMVEKVGSYDAPSAGGVVNEVENVYNDFGQLVEQYQAHDGAVNAGTTPKVEYGYADGSENTIRPESLTYPNGRALEYLYDDEAADALSRVRTLCFDEEDVARYEYLGLDSFVQVEYPEPDILYNLATGPANAYAGLDRFGRIVDLLWEPANNASSSSSSIGADHVASLKFLYQAL